MSDQEQQRGEPFRERNGSAVATAQEEIRRHIKDLLSDDFHVRSESVTGLEKYGEDAAQALVGALMNKSLPAQAVSTISEALEGIGKRSILPLVGAMNHLADLRTPEEAFLLECIIETVGRIRDRRAVPALLEQFAKLNRAIRRNGNRVLVDACESARVRIHLILSELGERSALDDLLAMLGDGRGRVRDGIVRAVAKSGDRRALLPLLRLHEIESPVSYAGAHDIREALRDIFRRERLSPDDAMFQNLKTDERAAIDRTFQKAKNGNGQANGNGHAK